MTKRDKLALRVNKLMADVCDHIVPERTQCACEEWDCFDCHLERIRNGENEPDWYNTKQCRGFELWGKLK